MRDLCECPLFDFDFDFDVDVDLDVDFGDVRLSGRDGVAFSAVPSRIVRVSVRSGVAFLIAVLLA